MQCRMCRSVIADASAQCPVCGTTLRNLAPPVPTAAPAPPEAERRQFYQRTLLPPSEAPRIPAAPRPRSYGLVTAAVAALIVGGALLAGWFLHAGKRRAATVYPLGSQERILEIGDAWTYAVKAVVTLGGSEVARVTGTIDRQIQKSKLYPDALQDKYIIKFKGKGIPGMPVFHLTATFVQDPRTGEMRVLGLHDHAGRFRRIAQPGVVETGLWFLERNNTYNIRYEDGAAEVLVEKVTGTELVSTPAGKFHAWKVEMGYEGVDTMLAASGFGTAAYVPQLGSPAYEKITLHGPLGITAEGDLHLESTNVSVDDTQAAPLRPPIPSAPDLLLRTEPRDRVK